jgi:hypothetical protein
VSRLHWSVITIISNYFHYFYVAARRFVACDLGGGEIGVGYELRVAGGIDRARAGNMDNVKFGS